MVWGRVTIRVFNLLFVCDSISVINKLKKKNSAFLWIGIACDLLREREEKKSGSKIMSNGNHACVWVEIEMKRKVAERDYYGIILKWAQRKGDNELYLGLSLSDASTSTMMISAIGDDDAYSLWNRGNQFQILNQCHCHVMDPSYFM